MKIGETYYRSIWPSADGRTVHIIDQTVLPHVFATRQLTRLECAIEAIANMRVRGAPLIGITAAYGVALAMNEDAGDRALSAACEALLATRPTAVNLAWALTKMHTHLAPLGRDERAGAAWALARELAEDDVAQNALIGREGLAVLAKLADQLGAGSADRPLNILTHCNAGWLAAVDWGTALAPIFMAHDAGLRVHVWVDETRPRSQGLLTSWELASHGVPHTVIADNAGGHLMRAGLVDACIVGADRVAANGDTANKIGTYLKALAASDNRVPFYVAVPLPTFDWSLADGSHIAIEERDGHEVRVVRGIDVDGQVKSVAVLPKERRVANPGFDVTPARLVTSVITPCGTYSPSALAHTPELRASV